GDVFFDAGDCAKFVMDALDPDRRDGGATEGREQDAAQRVADRGAVAALERLDREPRIAVRGAVFHFNPLGNYKVRCYHVYSPPEQGSVPSHVAVPGLSV